MRRLSRTLLAAALLLSGACDARAQSGALDGWNFDAPVARHTLSSALHEVSGLALTPDGRLFAHGDEQAEILQIDVRSGARVKGFTLGSPALTGDFEGIAIVGERFFLVTSGATIVEFREGSDGESVTYTEHEHELHDCEEIEGLEHDPSSNTLLLVCKVARRNALIVYTFDLAAMEMAAEPRVHLDRDVLRASGLDRFNPSGIARLPGGTWLVIGARQQRIIELSPTGEVLGARALPDSHGQAEGIALLPDGNLAIADEGGDGQATLTIYRSRP